MCGTSSHKRIQTGEKRLWTACLSKEIKYKIREEQRMGRSAVLFRRKQWKKGIKTPFLTVIAYVKFKKIKIENNNNVCYNGVAVKERSTQLSWIEHAPSKRTVGGSNPSVDAIEKESHSSGFFLYHFFTKARSEAKCFYKYG